MANRELRALIVDDEPVARQVLREELAELPGVALVGEAENGPRAVQQIRDLQPDLVLLDVQMPGMDGFEVVRRIEGPLPPAIIFVTAYDEYALKAFDVGAIDYLLKPVGQERLQAAIDRAQTHARNPRHAAERMARVPTRAPPIARRQCAK
jgi:DNA-binding LytR/AlgR family response regulator